MDVPINVDVYCDNVVCGRSTHVVLNPKTQQVTHVVVQEKGLANGEYLVALEQVVESSPTHIKLRATKAELVEMPQFIVTEYVSPETMPVGGVPYDPMLDMYTGYALWPYNTMDEIMFTEQHEETPPGELALVRGAHVIATDGRVGRVDEFLTDPVGGKITHLIMRKGHLWGQKDVTIPVDQIDHIERDNVYLKVAKQAVATLPAMRV